MLQPQGITRAANIVLMFTEILHILAMPDFVNALFKYISNFISGKVTTWSCPAVDVNVQIIVRLWTVFIRPIHHRTQLFIQRPKQLIIKSSSRLGLLKLFMPKGMFNRTKYTRSAPASPAYLIVSRHCCLPCMVI